MKNFLIMCSVGFLLAVCGLGMAGRAVYLHGRRSLAEKAEKARIEARENEAAAAYVDAIRNGDGREEERELLRRVAEKYPDTESGRHALDEFAEPVVSLVD